MNPGTNGSLKRKRFEYVKRNIGLLEALYSLALCSLYELSRATYGKIVEYLEKKRENTAGLLIRLERGVSLRLIDHDEESRLKERNYYLSEKGEELYASKELLIDEDKKKMVMEIKKKIKEERIKKEERMRERLKYIS